MGIVWQLGGGGVSSLAVLDEKIDTTLVSVR